MRVSETLSSAIKTLLSNKVRAFLTTLGVTIGVFAVIVLVSFVQGIQNFVIDRFNSLGSNLVLVAPGRASFSRDPAIAFSDNKLDIKHVELINRYVGEHLVGVSPNIRLRKSVQYKTNKYYANVIGGNEKVLTIIDIEIDSGRFFTRAEAETKARVAVIGPTIRKELFGNINPIDKEIKVDDTSFLIIGLTKETGIRSDDSVIIPYSTVQHHLDIKTLSGITAKALDTDNIDFVMKKVRLALLQDLKKDEFTVLSQKDILSSVQNILGILSIGLAAVAGISLVVGGIGIMNIMLVSVTERTREIGLRKALGATSSNIAVQFLIEAVVISLVGGSLGLMLSFLTTFAIQSIIRAVIPWWVVLMAIGFSAIVGVIFGTYPAVQASKKDPVVALQYE